MKLHEYQAKSLLRDFGVAVPEGRVAATADEAVAMAGELGGKAWLVKAQIHAGARGKGGGVKLLDNLDSVRAFADELLGSQLVTPQTDAKGLPVNSVLVEKPSDIQQEFYLSMLVDRAKERIVVIGSAAGGMDIEQVAAEQPGAIHSVCADIVAGLQPFHCRRLAFKLGLGEHIRPFTQLLIGLYRIFTHRDLSMLEINPLALTAEGELLPLDAKLTLDDNALYRQQALAALEDTSQEDATELEAASHDLNYVTLGGDIGCMVNGAGLAMATMDLIKLHGGEPANFLDVGGGTTAERVGHAFRIILSDSRVKAILVNIFGGIVRCDLIAEGIIQAVKDVGLKVPVVVRLEGTNVEKGLEMLAHSGLDIDSAEGLTEAAKLAVKRARGVA